MAKRQIAGMVAATVGLTATSIGIAAIAVNNGAIPEEAEAGLLGLGTAVVVSAASVVVAGKSAIDATVEYEKDNK